MEKSRLKSFLSKTRLSSLNISTATVMVIKLHFLRYFSLPETISTDLGVFESVCYAKVYHTAILRTSFETSAVKLRPAYHRKPRNLIQFQRHEKFLKKCSIQPINWHTRQKLSLKLRQLGALRGQDIFEKAKTPKTPKTQPFRHTARGGRTTEKYFSKSHEFQQGEKNHETRQKLSR